MTTSPTNYTDNIYTADGTLAGNRNVTFNSNNLAFDTDKLFIDGGSGNVGVGTTAPTQGKLVIQQSASSTSSSGLTIRSDNNNTLRF